MAAHATLSPSAADRWIQCTPSALLESREPRTSSVYADEGTCAHAFAAAELNYMAGLIDSKEYDRQMAEVRRDKLFKPGMGEHVDMYVDHILDRFRKMQKIDPQAVLMVEHRLGLTKWVPGAFGTSDAIIIGANSVCIFDLKYGQGVKVSAIGNSQLRMYALGALSVANMFIDVGTVYMCIIQPRMDNLSEDSMPVTELERWAKDVLVPAAALAAEGKGELCAGDHCGFCKVKPKCRAFADLQLELARYNFLAAGFLELDEIADILKRAKQFTDWLKAVRVFAMEQALAGEQLPGLKLVEGRGRRYWTDEGAAIRRLDELGYTFDNVTDTKLKGITDLTALLGKKQFETEMENYLVRKPGKPTFVDLSDPRPALTGAADDFNDLIGEDED